ARGVCPPLASRMPRAQMELLVDPLDRRPRKAHVEARKLRIGSRPLLDAAARIARSARSRTLASHQREADHPDHPARPGSRSSHGTTPSAIADDRDQNAILIWMSCMSVVAGARSST